MAAKGKIGGLSQDQALLLAGGIGVLLIYLKGKGKSGGSTGTPAAQSSTVSAPSSPTATVTSMGHNIAQPISPGQLTPNEPGTSPIITTNGVSQYGGS